MSDEFPSAPPAPDVPAPGAAGTGQAPPEGDTGRMLAGLGYIIWIVALVALLMEPYKDDPWVKQHALQALVLQLAISIIGGATSVILVGFLILAAGWIYCIVLAIKAFKGESFEVPLVTNLIRNYI